MRDVTAIPEYMSESRTELTKEAQTVHSTLQFEIHAAHRKAPCSSYRARQRAFVGREFLASGESEGATPPPSDERVSD